MEFQTLIDLMKPLQISGPLPDSIRAVAIHTNDIQPGSIFIALPSVWPNKPGGEQYVGQAIERGAVAIVSALPVPQDFPLTLCWIQVENPHRAVALIAKSFFPSMPEHMLAITGTNGKTSVADFTYQLWNAARYPCARLGTIGGVDCFGNDYGSNGYTTPTAIILHQTLEALVSNGVKYLAMETASHALVQHRLDQCRFEVAAFTNLTHEHLDYHKDMESYFQAKALLFTHLLADDGVAVLNKDDSVSKRLKSMIPQRVVTYGVDNADITYRIDDLHEVGQNLTVNVFGRLHQIQFPLIGHFQVSNAMCALADALLTGVDEKLAIESLSHLKSVPGRLQQVGTQVYVDYAHTPDALETVLRALRSHTRGRLSVVFGCGGNRDPYKRPEMGKIAKALADVVYVTDDNPRFEEASTIRSQILGACPGAIEIASRSEAIVTAIHDIRPGDIVLVAGKGHETGQIIGNEVQPFNDVTEAQNALSQKD